MLIQVNMNKGHRAVELVVENIAPANYDDVVMKILACAVRIDATEAVEVREDSAINAAENEPECVTESKE